MLETIGAAPGVKSDIDWPAVWRFSEEYRGVQTELQRLKQAPRSGDKPVDESDYAEFAASFVDQLRYAMKRTFQQYWRSPAYINSKALLTIGAVSHIYIHHQKIKRANIGYSHCLSASLSSCQTTPNRASRTRCLAFSFSSSWSYRLSCRSFPSSFCNGSYTKRGTCYNDTAPWPFVTNVDPCAGNENAVHTTGPLSSFLT